MARKDLNIRGQLGGKQRLSAVGLETIPGCEISKYIKCMHGIYEE